MKNRFKELAKKLSPSGNGKLVQDDFCKAFEHLKSKGQTAGNCIFASPKAALQALIILLRVPQNTPVKELDKAFEATRIQSKKLLTEIRMYFLEKYLQNRTGATLTKADRYLIKKMIRSIEKRISKNRYEKNPIDLRRYPRVKNSLLEYRHNHPRHT